MRKTPYSRRSCPTGMPPMTPLGNTPHQCFIARFEGSRISDVPTPSTCFHSEGPGARRTGSSAPSALLLRAIFAPLALANAIRAWFAASGGSQDLALVDRASGEVKPYDMVVMRGRWVFDRGHDGYNEMHAVRTLQKVPGGTVPLVALASTPTDQDFLDFQAFRKRWCDLTCEVLHTIGRSTQACPGWSPTRRSLHSSRRSTMPSGSRRTGGPSTRSSTVASRRSLRSDEPETPIARRCR